MKNKKSTELLGGPLKNIVESTIQDGIKGNADLSYRAGCESVVIRQTDGKCCEWCTDKAGEYEYPCDGEVFRRHDNCGCTVLCKTEKGVQNVHTKQFVNHGRNKLTNKNIADKINARYTELKQVEDERAAKEQLYESNHPWKSKAILNNHFQKHKDHYPGITVEQYKKETMDFAKLRESDDILITHRTDGSWVKYRVSTNDFMIIGKDGTIRSFFKPTEGIEYYERNI